MLALHAPHVPHRCDHITTARVSVAAVLSYSRSLALCSLKAACPAAARRMAPPHSQLLLTATMTWAMLALHTPRKSRRRRIIAAPTVAAVLSLALALSSSVSRRSLAAHSFRRKKQCPPTVPTVCPELNGSRSLFRCATVSCFWDQVSRHPFLARLPHPSSTPSCTASSPVQFFPQSRLYGRGRHARHPFLALQSLSLALPPARSSLSCLSSHIC